MNPSRKDTFMDNHKSLNEENFHSLSFSVRYFSKLFYSHYFEQEKSKRN